MTYTTISNWDVTDWNAELENMARDKFIPMIMEAGAANVNMVRTGDHTFTVLTQYADAKSAEAAQAKIAGIRAQVVEELPMTLANAVGGEVFAKG